MKKVLSDGREQWFKTIYWAGVTEDIPCINHAYSWSGRMPCTGELKCKFCGKPKEEPHWREEI